MRSGLIIITFLFLLFGDSPVFADSVLLNEIMANPVSPEKEWVELYNNSPSNVDITQWAITELTSSGNINSHPLPSVVVPSLSSCFFEFSNAVLNNDGDTVSLNNSSGTQIDSYKYTSTTQGKTFSRVPDGANWQTSVTSPTKSNTDCNNLLVAATTTPTPSPTTIPSPTPQPAASFTITPSQTKINSDQSFSVNINLSMPNSQNSDYYLKGAFKIADGTRYLGLTKIGNSWVEYGDDYSDQYKITTDSSGNWSGSIEVKSDTLDNDYKGSGDYTFKIGRFTATGSGPTWSDNEATITINNTGTSPSNNPSPQPTPKITPPTSSPTPFNSPNPPNHPAFKIASIAGIATSASESTSPEIKVEVKDQKQINGLIWVGIFFIFAGGGTIGYIYFKKNAKLHLWFRR